MKCRAFRHSAASFGRSPCGERGLKLRRMMELSTPRGRSPCGERGLKSIGKRGPIVEQLSLPVRGAWVEILFRVWVQSYRQGRSPCGERGLKCHRLRQGRGAEASLPVRGAWVEIGIRVRKCNCRLSLPVRGAWVEISTGRFAGCWWSRRSPCGERGLKSDTGAPRRRPCGVAPRAGSVG